MRPGREKLQALSDGIQGVDQVRALFVTGSTARGEADDYSDLDLLAVTERQHLDLVSRRIETFGCQASRRSCCSTVSTSATFRC